MKNYRLLPEHMGEYTEKLCKFLVFLRIKKEKEGKKGFISSDIALDILNKNTNDKLNNSLSNNDMQDAINEGLRYYYLDEFRTRDAAYLIRASDVLMAVKKYKDKLDYFAKQGQDKSTDTAPIPHAEEGKKKVFKKKKVETETSTDFNEEEFPEDIPF